jgi:hypothetical protein
MNDDAPSEHRAATPGTDHQHAREAFRAGHLAARNRTASLTAPSEKLEHQTQEQVQELVELSKHLILAKAQLARARKDIESITGSLPWSITMPLRTILRWLGIDKTPSRKLQREINLVRSSGLFDEMFYLLQYPDIAESGTDPVQHYLESGSMEHRNPSASFDTERYLELNPDVASHPAQINPLIHYIKFGRAEGRLCS